MKKTNLRKSRGITLIALVITIIVLLILAGVAISMLSGENGILKKATEAKTKYGEAQEDEKSKLLDYDIATDLSTNNSPYKFCNGYLTGLRNETEKHAVNVKTAKENLPDGYEIYSYNEETKAFELAGEDELMKTGMIIKKNGEKVGEAIVYGDVGLKEGKSDGKIAAGDSEWLKIQLVQLYDICDIDKIASDVNYDNIVDWKDVKRIKIYASMYKPEQCSGLINQNVSAPNANSIKVESYEESMKNWVNSLEDSIKANFEWEDEKFEYLYTTKSVTVEEILKNMPGAAIVGGTSYEILSKEETVAEGDKIMLYPDFETTRTTMLLEIGMLTITE